MRLATPIGITQAFLDDVKECRRLAVDYQP